MVHIDLKKKLCTYFPSDPPQFQAAIITADTFNCSSNYEMCASYPGISATILCGADGNPLPTVNRSVSGVSDLSNVDLLTGSDITINSVTPSNAGTYTCVATSQVLSEPLIRTRTVRLYVGGKFVLWQIFVYHGY